MKKIVFSYFFIPSILLFFSCNNNTEKTKVKIPQGKAIINGSFKNAENIPSITLHLPEGTFKKILLIEGKFSDTLRLYKPIEASILITNPVTKEYVQNCTFYLEPSSELSLSADLKDFYNTLEFEGTLKNENDYIFQKRKKSFDIYEFNPVQTFKDEYSQYISLLKSEESFFMEKIDSAITIFNRMIDSSSLKESFKKYQKEGLKYETLASQMLFYNIKASEDPKYTIPQEILDDFFELDLSDKEAYSSYLTFTDIAKFAFIQKKQQTLKKASQYNLKLNRSKYLIQEINKIPIEKLRNDIIEETYPYLLSESNPEARDSYKELIKSSNISDQTLKRNIKNRYKKIKNFIPGNIAYDFTAISKSGYLKRLSNYKGSPVLLQIWATWHKSSIKELLYMKLLQQDNGNSVPIKIISVSIDKDKDSSKWIGTINRLNLPGIHLRIQDNEIDNFLKNYNISDKLPKYILIDELGTIAQSDMPFPSQDPSFKDLIIFDPNQQLKKAQEELKKVFKK